MCRRTTLAIVLATLLPAALAQQVPADALPETRAFEVLFKEIRLNDRHLAELGSQAGQSTLRGRYQALFSLSEEDDQALKRAAISCLAETDPLDRQAAEIILAVKNRYRPPVAPARAGRVPPPPPELLALQERKDAVIRKHLDSLDRSLGRGGLAILAAQVRRHVASHSRGTRNQ